MLGTQGTVTTYRDFFAERDLVEPRGLAAALAGDVGERLMSFVYWSGSEGDQPASLVWGLDLLRDAVDPPPPTHLPLLPVDGASVACVVCKERDSSAGSSEPFDERPNEVVRWHLGSVDAEFQGARLDSDVVEYLKSVAEELDVRAESLPRLMSVARRYYKEHVTTETRPRAFVVRPVQLACQNVIVGLATLQHDSTFDGLRVEHFLTCEVPHVATHEANRAMASLLLCDAFQNGGTMEIRFGPKRAETPVPTALRRFARSLDLSLGGDDARAISPVEARELFLAVTPMPDDLRARAYDLFDRGLIAPERMCYALMSGIWKPVELDYLMATSSRVVSILAGGASPELRRARLAEAEVCRSALIVGMLLRRLDGVAANATGESGVRLIEDAVAGVAWSVLEEHGAVAFHGVDGEIPWSHPLRGDPPDHDGTIIVVPRGLPTPSDLTIVEALQREYPGAGVYLVLPADMAECVPAEVPVLVCPDRLVELDADIERRLMAARVGRA